MPLRKSHQAEKTKLTEEISKLKAEAGKKVPEAAAAPEARFLLVLLGCCLASVYCHHT